jgi:hypothetical protein
MSSPKKKREKQKAGFTGFTAGGRPLSTQAGGGRGVTLWGGGSILCARSRPLRTAVKARLFAARMGLDEDLWSAAECNDISTVSFPLFFLFLFSSKTRLFAAHLGLDEELGAILRVTTSQRSVYIYIYIYIICIYIY